MLSFSKCYEIDEILQFRIWHSALAPYEASEKNSNMGAQLQSLMCTTAPKIFRKIYFLYDFWWVQTYLFLAIFFTTNANFDNCCQCQIATCVKQIICVIYVFSALNQCGKILLQFLCYLYEVVHTNFFANFGSFCNFQPQFRENCGAT